MRTVPGGHDFHEDSDGDVDGFYYEIGFHNGPGCRDCGKSWCQHCTDSYFPEGYTGGRVLDGPTGVYAEKCPAIIDAAPDQKEIKA